MKFENELKEYKKNGVMVIDNFLSEDKAESILEFVNKLSEHRWQVREWEAENSHIVPDLKIFPTEEIDFCYDIMLKGNKLTPATATRFDIGEGIEGHEDGSTVSKRSLTIMYYLNKDWDISYGGNIRLIDYNKKEQVYEPLFNRLVIFDTSLKTGLWHSVDKVTTDRSRYALLIEDRVSYEI